MTLALPFSETNVANSLATYLATQLLDSGYLVYWSQRDAVQAPSGWYYQYAANAAAYLAAAPYDSEAAAARGLVTVVDAFPANARFAQRPTTDGTVREPDAIGVPAVAIEVAPAVPLGLVEMGNRQVKWRVRHVVLEAAVRTEAEYSWFKDALAAWFDPETMIDIADHDAGTAALVGSARIERSSVASTKEVHGPEAATYRIVLDVLLEYVA